MTTLPDTSPQRAGTARSGTAADALHFVGFSILPGQRRLLIDGEPAKIGARAFDLLMVLVSSRDRVVSKDELLDRVWQGLVVDESNLPVHVSLLRRLCGAAVIATVPGRGYQFTAVSRGVSTFSRTAEADQLRPRALEGGQLAGGGKLPAVLQPLIGRDAELLEVVQMLSEQRFVTVSGGAGMGKTRLAEAVGRQLAEQMPVWMIELASVNAPGQLLGAVGQALGVTVIDGGRLRDAVLAALSGTAALLILDNCEHLAEAVGQLCSHLLGELPQLRVLVTSQELLRRAEEAVYKLGPLSLPKRLDLAGMVSSGALMLLQARLRSQWRQFEFTADNLGDAVSICRQLDGMPLAIELAAGRVPLLGLAGVRARLGEMFRLLTGDARVRLRRHQTLRAALDWSYQLLDASEQRLLCRLGTFNGSFGLPAVREIGADPGEDDWQVLDTLGSLIDKSLVQVRDQLSPRYLLLETTRAYALERLALAGETEAALARHAHATSKVCSQATRQRDTQAIWNEAANVSAAFAWAMRHGDRSTAIALAVDNCVVFALGGLFGEVLDRLLAVGPFIDDGVPTAQAAQYWQWLGRFGNDGRLPARRCVEALCTAESLFRQLGNHRHVHACLRMRAEALLDLGQTDAAFNAIDEARQMEVQGHPPADRMRRLRIEGMVLDARGQCAAAVERLEQALALAQQADIHRYTVTLTQDIGQTLLSAGDAVAAERRFRAVLDDQQPDVSVALAVAYARMGLVTALLMQGKQAQAHVDALAALPLLRSCGILLAHAECLAWLLATLGHPRSAAIVLRTAAAFRAHSQTACSCVDLTAQGATLVLLRDRGVDYPGGHQAIQDGDELAQFVLRALAEQGDPAPTLASR